MISFALAENSAVLATQMRESMATGSAGRVPSGIGFFFGRAQKIDQLARPRSLGGFFQIDEFSQFLDITKRVGAVLFPIERPEKTPSVGDWGCTLFFQRIDLGGRDSPMPCLHQNFWPGYFIDPGFRRSQNPIPCHQWYHIQTTRSA